MEHFAQLWGYSFLHNSFLGSKWVDHCSELTSVKAVGHRHISNSTLTSFSCTTQSSSSKAETVQNFQSASYTPLSLTPSSTDAEPTSSFVKCDQEQMIRRSISQTRLICSSTGEGGMSSSVCPTSPLNATSEVNIQVDTVSSPSSLSLTCSSLSVSLAPMMSSPASTNSTADSTTSLSSVSTSSSTPTSSLSTVASDTESMANSSSPSSTNSSAVSRSEEPMILTDDFGEDQWPEYVPNHPTILADNLPEEFLGADQWPEYVLPNNTNPSLIFEKKSDVAEDEQLDDPALSPRTLIDDALADFFPSKTKNTTSTQTPRPIIPELTLGQQISKVKAVLKTYKLDAKEEGIALETFILNHTKDLKKTFKGYNAESQTSQALDEFINKNTTLSEFLEKFKELFRIEPSDKVGTLSIEDLITLAQQRALLKFPVGRIKKLSASITALPEKTSDEKSGIRKGSFFTALDTILVKYSIAFSGDSKTQKKKKDKLEQGLEKFKDTIQGIWGDLSDAGQDWDGIKTKKIGRKDFDQILKTVQTVIEEFSKLVEQEEDQNSSLVSKCKTLVKFAGDILNYHDREFVREVDHSLSAGALSPTPSHLSESSAEVHLALPKSASRVPSETGANSGSATPASPGSDSSAIDRLAAIVIGENLESEDELQRRLQELQQTKEEFEKAHRVELEGLFSKDPQLDDSNWKSCAKLSFFLDKALEKKKAKADTLPAGQDKDQYKLLLDTARDYLHLNVRNYGLMLQLISENKWNLVGAAYNKWILSIYGIVEKLYNTEYSERDLPQPTVHNIEEMQRALKIEYGTSPEGRERTNLISKFKQANLQYRYPKSEARNQNPVQEVLKKNIALLDTLEQTMARDVKIDNTMIKDCRDLLTFITQKQQVVIRFIQSNCELSAEETALIESFCNFTKENRRRLDAKIAAQGGTTIRPVDLSRDYSELDRRLDILQQKVVHFRTKLDNLRASDVTNFRTQGERTRAYARARRASAVLEDAIPHFVMLRGALRLQTFTYDDNYLLSLHYNNSLEGHWPLEQIYKAEMHLFGIEENRFARLHNLKEFDTLLEQNRIRIVVGPGRVTQHATQTAKTTITERLKSITPCDFRQSYDTRLCYDRRPSDKAPHGLNRQAAIIDEAAKDVWVPAGTTRQGTPPSRTVSTDLMLKEIIAFEKSIEFLLAALKDQFPRTTWDLPTP